MEGSRVLILGAGAIGLLSMTAVQEAGGTVSLVTEVNPERLATAKKWGAQDVCDARSQDPVEVARQITGGLGVDVAIDAVGSTATRKAAVRSVRAGGVVVFIGLHEEESLLETNYVIRSEIHITGTFAYTPRDFAKAVAMLAAKKVRVSNEWLEERNLEACAASFTQLVDGSPAVAKITLHP
jgi:threonine dehydrogenase-like Zn-dependent dehydrogenase